MKHVRVQYFAMLREQAHCHEETIGTAAGTPAALYEELRRRHGFSLAAAQLKVAVDGDFAAWDTPLANGACVVFIPPFAGG
jgi:molybdopterin converting factor small subunit